MNRRYFLRTSGIASVLLGGVTPQTWTATPEDLAQNPQLSMAVLTAGSTAFSILLANELSGRSLASDWTTAAANLRAIEAFWIANRIDEVVAGPLSRLTARALTADTLALDGVLADVNSFNSKATLVQLRQATSVIDQIPQTKKQEMLRNLQRDGFLICLQAAAHAAERMAAEIRGFTLDTGALREPGIAMKARRSSALSDAPQSMSMAGLVFATLAALEVPRHWSALRQWGASATGVAGVGAQMFA